MFKFADEDCKIFNIAMEICEPPTPLVRSTRRAMPM